MTQYLSRQEANLIRNEEAFYEARITSFFQTSSIVYEDSLSLRETFFKGSRSSNKRSLDSGKDYREDSLDYFKGKG
jgi:hypothetical protein